MEMRVEFNKKYQGRRRYFCQVCRTEVSIHNEKPCIKCNNKSFVEMVSTGFLYLVK